ncbi:WD repeat-containing protein, putative [Plasmodium vivax]|uniref:WD repeat-containing protein, putative n=2 Tax=Plasmodium vivax TaxID=5855 RepID=A0A1G4HHB1_PLAVI|nr:hypothetical protein PVNG_00465 [Plasmodium vivax North Korean]CAI7722292.1 WD repeat-containing protein, putative [Plasmodium vivax]SCO74321.1 WD repeat-containing protein, putative [Plasmodium vivax]
MKHSRGGQPSERANTLRRSKYQLRGKKSEAGKNAQEEESDGNSNEASDSSLSCSSKYMTREENVEERGTFHDLRNGQLIRDGLNCEVDTRVDLPNDEANYQKYSLHHVSNAFTKQTLVYDHYKRKDILLSLWWKNMIDLYSDILITNVYSNVSNIDVLNMNRKVRENYEYLNEGIVLFHNSSRRENYKMSILRVVTKEQVNKKNEKEIFYSSSLRDNTIDDSFKKYYKNKYKNIPVIKRYNCLNLPYYCTNSSILYCGRDGVSNQGESDWGGDAGNVIIAGKSIRGNIFLYNVGKTIDRINRMEDEEAEDRRVSEDGGGSSGGSSRSSGDSSSSCRSSGRSRGTVRGSAKGSSLVEGEDEAEEREEGRTTPSRFKKNAQVVNSKNGYPPNWDNHHSRKNKSSESYKKKIKDRKICDGELLLELVGHKKTGKGLFFRNNYLLSNGDDKNIFIYDINGGTVRGSENKHENDHVNVSKMNPFISIKTNELYSNVRWLYDSLVIGSTYSGYFSLFDIRMRNRSAGGVGGGVGGEVCSVGDVCSGGRLDSGGGGASAPPHHGVQTRSNVDVHSVHKKITKYEISDIDKYNSDDNNLICMSSLNNIFIFDLRFINNNLPYKIMHDNSYNNYSINESYFEPYQTAVQNGEYSSTTNVNYFYDHSYNNYYNEDFFNSDTFIHSLFWCNIEGFNYIGSLNNKGIINLFDVNKSKHHCVFTYGCKYIKLFRFNPFKINNFVSVDKNNILILFTLPDQIYKSDLDLYLQDSLREG